MSEGTDKFVATADDRTLRALVVVVCGGDDDVALRGVGVVVVQGVSAQERTVRALIVLSVLVLGGFDKAAAEHSLSVGHM